MGIGAAILLAMAALFLPGGWFMLRDAASLGRMQGETLAPLMVAQLDRSYENDIYRRMSAYFAACAAGDVICSSKEVDAGNEALWDNIGQSEQSVLMQSMIDALVPYGELGKNRILESCTQHVLMRESDGQILLVTNDIRLASEDDSRIELLIDGLDGTIYYIGIEAHFVFSLETLEDTDAWELWWMLSENYHAQTDTLWTEIEQRTEVEQWGADAYTLKELKAILDRTSKVFVNSAQSSEYKEIAPSAYFEDAGWIRFMGNGPISAWVASWGDRDVYCCQLVFEHLSNGWSMVVTNTGKKISLVQMGFPDVVNAIPEMAERIELPQYNEIYGSGDQKEQAAD